MTPYAYLKEILRTLPEMAEQTGYPVTSLGWQFFRCYLAHRAEIDEFRSLRLYDCTPRRRGEYLLYKESVRLSDRLNAGADAAEIDTFNDKRLFNTAFAPFIRRRWLYLPRAGEDDVWDFLMKNPVFFVKACRSTQGKNIFRREAREVDPVSLNGEFPGDYLLEAPIRQHPALAAVNPSSVNTVRFIAARRGEAVAFIGAGLRCGGAGQFVDNFHHGGAAYPLDLETGVVTARGIDLNGDPILRHPTTGHIMPGFRVPRWEELLDTVRAASVVTPHIGYIGWDLAVTEEGVELVEGNINYPGNTIFQLDGPGARRRLVDFCAAQGILPG